MAYLTCREFIDFIEEYRDKRLEKAVRSSFEEHLKLCPECERYLETYETSTEVLRKACCEDPESALSEAPEQLIQAILAAKKKSTKSP